MVRRCSLRAGSRAVAFTVVLLVLGAVPAGAACTAPAPAGTIAASADELSARVVSAWLPSRQRPDGTFRDYVALPQEHARDHYGPAMLGAALVLNGVRTCRPAVTHAGLRALGWAADHPWPDLRRGGEARGVIFENMALAVAYDRVHDDLAGDPIFARVRPRWERRLRSMRLQLFGRKDAPAYYNWYLIETLAVAALEHSGLRSTVPGSILATPGVRHTVESYLDNVVLAKAGAETTPLGDQSVLLLSDPPENPPAYHELSLALFSKAVALLGGEPERAAVTTLDRMGRATWALMAPDGDVAWSGRSQEQSWTLPITAAGLLTTSRVNGILRPDADRMRAAAARAMARLAAPDYRSTRFGLLIAPVLGTVSAPRRAIAGMDPYASAAGYTGLTLLGLEWVAADANAALPTPAVPIAADIVGHRVRLARHGSFIVARSARTWMSVKLTPGIGKDHENDLRYETGLNALDVLDGAGVWRRVLPPRPHTHVFDPGGPVAILPSGARTRPTARTVAIAPDSDVIRMSVDYSTVAGRRVIAGRTVRFVPTACGAQIVIQSQPGETWEYSAFFPGHSLREGSNGVSDGTRRVSVDATAGSQVAILGPGGRRYQSGSDSALVRWRVRLAASDAAPELAFTVCLDMTR